MIHLEAAMATEALLVGFQVNHLSGLGAGHSDEWIVCNWLWRPRECLACEYAAHVKGQYHLMT